MTGHHWTVQDFYPDYVLEHFHDIGNVCRHLGAKESTIHGMFKGVAKGCQKMEKPWETGDFDSISALAQRVEDIASDNRLAMPKIEENMRKIQDLCTQRFQQPEDPDDYDEDNDHDVDLLDQIREQVEEALKEATLAQNLLFTFKEEELARIDRETQEEEAKRRLAALHAKWAREESEMKQKIQQHDKEVKNRRSLSSWSNSSRLTAGILTLGLTEVFHAFG